VLDVVAEIDQPMIDVFLHLDQRSWQRLVTKFGQFDLRDACKRKVTQIEHIKQDPIVKGKCLLSP